MKDRKFRRRVRDLEKLVQEQRHLIDHLDKVNHMHVQAEELSRQERLAADQMLDARQRLQELAEVERKEADRIIQAQQDLHALTEDERREAAELNNALIQVQALSDQERIESEKYLQAHKEVEELSTFEIRERDGILEEILNIGRQINKLIPEDELLLKILNSAMDHLDAENGAVVMYENGIPQLRTAMGFPEGTGEIRIYNCIEAAQVERQGGPGAAPKKNLTSIVSSLTKESRPVGALYLGKAAGGSCFRKMDLEFLDLFAAQASMALSNAHLFNSVRTRNKELRRALMLKNNFIEHLSDDLRKPLSRLNLMLQENDELDVDEAVKLSDWLMKALDKVLSIAALNQESEEMFSHKISIVEISNEIFHNLREEIKNLELKTEVTTEGVVPLFEGNRDVFYTILDEVICNAVVYNRVGGIVQIIVSVRNQRLFIVAKDTGIGISKKERNKVFNRFYRSEASYEHYSRGAGLGLYIVRSFVEDYGGSIALSSDKNKGTEVKIELPI